MGAGMAWQWDLSASLGWAASGGPGGSWLACSKPCRPWQVCSSCCRMSSFQGLSGHPGTRCLQRVIVMLGLFKYSACDMVQHAVDGEQDGGCFGDRPQPLGVLCGSKFPSFTSIDENMLEVTKSGSVLGWTLADGLAGVNDPAPRTNDVQAVGLTLTRCVS